MLPGTGSPGTGSPGAADGPGPSGGGTPVPMVAEGGGWWRSPSPVPAGTDYAFSLEGGPAMPDPRSPWQPYGVHGPSRTFDAGAHQWSDGAWAGRSVLGAVVYELHIGTFTPEGTLDAAVGRLDHLVALGVDMVELMPVAAFPGTRGWGYDGVALYAVHDPYGGPAALQRFVDAAHARGVAVCLDVVYNHLGPSGNYLGAFGPYFTERHHTPWGAAVNLDGDDAAEVRTFVVDNALRWLRDFHIDALRLDAVHALVDDSPRHLLAELSDAVADLEGEVGRPLSLVAESDLNDAKMVTATAAGGLGMTAQWNDDLHHALHALVTGERQGYYADFGSPETLAKALTDVFVHAGEFSSFRGKVWGAPVPPDVDRRRFVVFSQDHDQVGNRALGDRPSRALSPGRLAVSAAAVLLGPGTPHAVHGRGVGRRDAVPVLHRPRRAGARPGGAGGTRQGVRHPRVGRALRPRDRGAGPAGAGDGRGVPAGLDGAGEARARAGAGVLPGSHPAPAHRAGHRRRRAARRRRRRRRGLAGPAPRGGRRRARPR
ncbi:malto-oligosyltrehalose trehalohydrolase [Georgenia sp. SUBG003]|uniref:malto-oligosyltrehalose trehalohydrolase n=1 Tax=Georgenia sp. SUBG003 TaxID=1497974 RepID=UPI000AFF6958